MIVSMREDMNVRWYNIPLENMSLNLNKLFWSRANKSLLLTNVVWFAKKKHIVALQEAIDNHS